jgi:hypothetical protein
VRLAKEIGSNIIQRSRFLPYGIPPLFLMLNAGADTTIVGGKER